MIWEQIRSNQMRTTLLVVLMGVLLVALGFFIGLIFFDNGIPGVIIAVVVWGIMNLVALTQGDQIVLTISGARKIEKKDHPKFRHFA